ncbi:hypothetical protein BU15DRAFT_64062 [Melanogaster broomeanus]|nr:hypothetical protein BU15DRAFT_64062 [Melanogaster broomeanus]
MDFPIAAAYANDGSAQNIIEVLEVGQHSRVWVLRRTIGCAVSKNPVGCPVGGYEGLGGNIPNVFRRSYLHLGLLRGLFITSNRLSPPPHPLQTQTSLVSDVPSMFVPSTDGAAEMRRVRWREHGLAVDLAPICQARGCLSTYPRCRDELKLGLCRQPPGCWHGLGGMTNPSIPAPIDAAHGQAEIRGPETQQSMTCAYRALISTNPNHAHATYRRATQNRTDDKESAGTEIVFRFLRGTSRLACYRVKCCGERKQNRRRRDDQDRIGEGAVRELRGRGRTYQHKQQRRRGHEYKIRIRTNSIHHPPRCTESKTKKIVLLKIEIILQENNK